MLEAFCLSQLDHGEAKRPVGSRGEGSHPDADIKDDKTGKEGHKDATACIASSEAPPLYGPNC